VPGARAEFDRLRADGFVAYRRDPSGEWVEVRDFDAAPVSCDGAGGDTGVEASPRHGRTNPAAPVGDDGVPRDRVRDCDSSASLAGLGYLKDWLGVEGCWGVLEVRLNHAIVEVRNGGGGIRTHDRGCPRCRFSRSRAGLADELGLNR
jgi:hypothetical protein